MSVFPIYPYLFLGQLIHQDHAKVSRLLVHIWSNISVMLRIIIFLPFQVNNLPFSPLDHLNLFSWFMHIKVISTTSVQYL